MKIIIKQIAMLLLFVQCTYAQLSINETKDSVREFSKRISTNYLDGINAVSIIPFHEFYKYVSNAYPASSNDRYATTSAILTQYLFTANCPAIFDNDNNVFTAIYTILSVHNIIWQHLVKTTPNNKNQAIEAAANLINLAFLSEIICNQLNNNNNNVNTPYVDGANDYFSMQKNQSGLDINYSDNDVFTNINFNQLYTAFIGPLHGTLNNNGAVNYTPNTNYVGYDTIGYFYSYNGTPIASDESMYYIYINVIDTATNNDTTNNNNDTTFNNTFYTAPTLNICTEDIQGRLTWEFQYNNTGVANFDIQSVTLSVPTNTPNSVVDTTIYGTSGMITPQPSMRDDIATQDTYIIIRATHTFNGSTKYYEVEYLLPNFLQSDNRCEYNLSVNNFYDLIN